MPARRVGAEVDLGAACPLVTRLKTRYDPGPLLPLTVLLMGVGDFPTMCRMLLGIAERAEGKD